MDPRTVYFTNPGNYRIFEWHKIMDTCLITVNEAFIKGSPNYPFKVVTSGNIPW